MSAESSKELKRLSATNKKVETIMMGKLKTVKETEISDRADTVAQRVKCHL